MSRYCSNFTALSPFSDVKKGLNQISKKATNVVLTLNLSGTLCHPDFVFLQ